MLKISITNIKNNEIDIFNIENTGRHIMKKIAISLLTFLMITSTLSFASGHQDYSEYIDCDSIFFDTPTLLNIDSSTRLEIQQCDSVNTKSNSYVVPIKKLQYLYPQGTMIDSINIKPTHISSQILDFALEKTPTAQLLSNTDFEISNQQEITQSINQWYSADIGQGMISSTQRGIIVSIELYPAIYNQETQELTSAHNFQIQIATHQESRQQTSTKENYDLLILSADQYIDTLQTFKTHKETIEISTKIVSISEIETSVYFPSQGRDKVERIKYFIKNAIETWDITNLLIVGGSDSFPARTTHIKVSNDDREEFLSDLYYADIYDGEGNFSSWDSNNNNVFCEYNWGSSDDEIDFYPDVHFGRLPVIDESQLEDVIDKIITYEESNAYTQEWFKTIIYAGGDTFPGDDDQIDEGEYTNQAIMDVMDGYEADLYWASNGKLEGIAPAGVTKLKNGLNRGAGFVDMSGHGNTRSWATHPHENPSQWLPQPTMGFLVSHAESLSNEELSIVITGACSVAKYDEEPDNFCWAFVKNPDGGAIACFGCSALGYGYSGSYVTQGLIGAFEVGIFEAYKNYQAYTIGELLSITINNYIFSNMDEADVKMVTEYHLFGDPSIQIADETFPPITPDAPSGPDSGSVGIRYHFSTSTTDPENNQISYQFDWGDGEISDWTRYYPQSQSVSESHYWQNEGQYSVKVRARDTKGLVSNWSSASLLSISPPQIDIGIVKEIGSLTFEFTNNADDDFSDISWNYSVHGGFFGKIAIVGEGIFQSFPSAGLQQISLEELLFGFGSVKIDVYCDQTEIHEEIRLFGPFIL